MKPLLKYRGGKSRELSEFRRFIPKEFDKYLEPFLGGGAVFFDIAAPKSRSLTLSLKMQLSMISIQI